MDPNENHIPDFLAGIAIQVAATILGMFFFPFKILLIIYIIANLGLMVYIGTRNRATLFGMVLTCSIPLMLYGACEGMMF